jgi:acetyl-CoA acetyltransferase family protein
MNTWIPYGAYWSTPLAKWQGSFAGLHAIKFAAHVTKAEMARRGLDPKMLDFGVLGLSVPQTACFYGLPWLTGMIGAHGVAGPTVSQACATSVRSLRMAALEVESGAATAALVQCCDRMSNGPHIYYPNPQGPGGTGSTEDWVLANFARDPLTDQAMVVTGENVARKHGFTTAQQHEVVLMRQAQYDEAVADDHAFQKRFITLPFDVPDARFIKVVSTLSGDEGLTRSTAEGLAKLKPVVEGGTVTYGGQTHPADGNAAMIVASRDKARELSKARIGVRLAGFGQARVEPTFMPEAPIPAARQALDCAGLAIRQIDAVKTHNPFALNDLCFAKETGFPLERMNNYGCSLIYGHPQGPMGLRGVMELIEELVLRGGGFGLFSGCAAGDTAMAVVLEVRDLS